MVERRKVGVENRVLQVEGRTLLLDRDGAAVAAGVIADKQVGGDGRQVQVERAVLADVDGSAVAALLVVYEQIQHREQ
jgi:hypothetical protein